MRMAHLGFPGGPSFLCPFSFKPVGSLQKVLRGKGSRTGGQSVTNERIQSITRLQQAGKGYRTIATETGLPVNSVKSWCKRHPVGSTGPSLCQQCGTPLHPVPGKRAPRFCSDACRLAWWKAHPEQKSHRVSYPHVCRFCGTEFSNNRVTASYCSRSCFARARAQVASDG